MPWVPTVWVCPLWANPIHRDAPQFPPWEAVLAHSGSESSRLHRLSLRGEAPPGLGHTVSGGWQLPNFAKVPPPGSEQTRVLME